MSPKEKPEPEKGEELYPDAHYGREDDPTAIGKIVQGLYGDQFVAGPLSAQDFLLELTKRRIAGELIDDAAMEQAIKAADNERLGQRKE